MINKFACLVLLFFVGEASAQNIGIGTNTPDSKLDINGDIALRSASINIASTYTYALDVYTTRQANYRLIDTNVTAVGNFIIAGITAGADGRQITLYNRTGSSMQIFDEDVTAIAANRIRTGIGGTLAVYNGGAVILRYDTSLNRWEVSGSHYSSLDYFGADAAWSLTGNTGTTSANFIGTNDEQPLRFRINGGSAGIIDSSLGNTALGVAALRNNSTGFNNIAIGKNALKSNSNYAQNNVAIGAGALENNIYAEGHIAIGYQALQNFTNNNFPAGTFGANHNTAVGYKTLQNNADAGTSNTAVGGMVLKDNTTGFNNTAMGDFAMWKNTTGNSNVAIGAQSVYENLVGSDNVAIGSVAMLKNKVSKNTAVGSQALYSNENGPNNTAIGFQALKNVAYSENNTAVGAFTLVAGGYRCTAIGSAALNSNFGFDNVGIGMSALGSNTSGVENTSCGSFSLYVNTTGSSNVAIGDFSLGGNSTGSRNTSMGWHTLNANTTGINNTALGYNSLNTNTTGNWNTCIGDNSNTSINNLNGAAALGTGAISNADNKIVIGANVAGMVVGGYSAWNNLSDGRFKKNIHTDVPGLEFITQLRPVTYTIDIDKLQHHITAQMPDSIAKQYYPTAKDIKMADSEVKTGFIAQEVEVLSQKLGYQFDGVTAPKNSTDNYSIAYSQFVVPLVKAVQEQQEMIKELQKLNQALLKRIEKLELK